MNRKQEMEIWDRYYIGAIGAAILERGYSTQDERAAAESAAVIADYMLAERRKRANDGVNAARDPTLLVLAPPPVPPGEHPF